MNYLEMFAVAAVAIAIFSLGGLVFLVLGAK